MSKILFVSARLPFPMIEGHQIRTFGILSQLAKNNEVHLFSLLRPGEKVPKQNMLTQLCSSITGYQLNLGLFNNIRAGLSSLVSSKPLMITRYISNDLKVLLHQQIEEIQPDIIHFDLLTLAGLFDVIPEHIPVVLNEHNIEADLIKQKMEGLPSGLMKLILNREYNLLSQFERSACQKASVVMVCSNFDQRVLANYGIENVYTIPNGVDTDALLPDNSKQTNHFVFLGGMGWYPNKRGMEWFIKDVMPLLVKKEPSIQIDVIGNPEPHLLIPPKYADNINILGFVDDFKPLVQQSLAMIVPLNVGSGTRLKVLEGMALGKCIISTRKGAEGISLTHNESIVYADDPESFSAAMLDLLRDQRKAIKIGENARKIALQYYDWKVIGRNLNQIFNNIS